MKSTPPLTKPKISHQEALAVAKELALLNGIYWDDQTAKAELRGDRLPILCWRVMPGFEPKEWIEQEIDDYPICFLIDAETGKFAGLDGGRVITSASEIVGKSFKLPYVE